MAMISLLILEYAILASTFTIAKVAISYAKPFFLIGFRMTLAGLFLIGFLFLRGQFKRIERRDLLTFIRIAFFHIYIAFSFEFWALQYITSIKTTIIYSTTPFVAALLARILLHEKMTLMKMGAMFIGLTGLIPIIMTQEIGSTPLGELFHVSIPEAVLMISVVSAAYAWFLIKRLMQRGYQPMHINGFAMLTGGLASFATSFVFEGIHESPVFDLQPFLFWTLLLIIVANIISYNFYTWLLRFYSVTFMTFAGFLCPVFGSFFGWFFLNEPLSWHHAVSLILVGIGLSLFYQAEKRLSQQKYSEKEIATD